MKKNNLKIGEYHILETIGHGGNGIVQKVKRISDGKIFAMKQVHNIPDLRKLVLDEVNIMRKLDHPNLIKYYEMIETPDYFNIIMEYASNGNLRQLMTSSMNKD
jgi:serine/threonine protein kinase